MKKQPAEIIKIIPFLFILPAFYLPLINLFRGGISLHYLKDFLSKPYYFNLFIFTFKQAFFSSLYSVLPALAGAYFLSHYSFRFKKLIKAVTAVPFVLPPILVVLGFVLLFGNNGLINRTLMDLFNLDKPPLRILYSFKAIILAHIFFNFPLAVRLISASWEKISVSLIDAAKSLGAGKVRVFTQAVLPQLMPSILASFSLIFILCFMSFSIILVLGGGPKNSTVEVEIYRLARINFNIPGACSLAVVQSAVSLFFLLVYTFFQKKNTHAVSVNNAEILTEKKVSKMSLVFLIIFLAVLFIVIILPMGVVIIESFKYKTSRGADTVFSLHWYKKSFSEVGFIPVRNSLMLASVNTVVSVLMALAAASYSSGSRKGIQIFIEFFFTLSLGVSSIILTLSYIKFMNDFHIRQSGWIPLVAAQTLSFLPFVFKSITIFYDRIDSSIMESAMSLGASWKRIFCKIEVPMVKNGLFTGAVLAFALSMGEINATLMVAPDNFITIPLAIYRLIGSYNFFQACAMGTILIVTSAVSFMVLDRAGTFEL